MSVELCIELFVIPAAHGERILELSRVQRTTGDAFFARTGDEETWERAGEELAAASRAAAVVHHVFRLPEGDKIYSEVAQRVRQVGRLAFELYGAHGPDEVRAVRDALARTRAVGETDVIASMPESRRRPETARRLIALLAETLDACGDDKTFVIVQRDGVWDDAPAGEPLEERLPSDDGELEARLAWIDRATREGRVSARDHEALAAAMRRASREPSVDALLDVAIVLGEIEETLSEN